MLPLNLRQEHRSQNQGMTESMGRSNSHTYTTKFCWIREKKFKVVWPLKKMLPLHRFSPMAKLLKQLERKLAIPVIWISLDFLHFLSSLQPVKFKLITWSHDSMATAEHLLSAHQIFRLPTPQGRVGQIDTFIFYGQPLNLGCLLAWKQQTNNLCGISPVGFC